VIAGGTESTLIERKDYEGQLRASQMGQRGAPRRAAAPSADA
jgi:hypothetical protein